MNRALFEVSSSGFGAGKNGQKRVQGIDGGLHPAMDGQSLGESCWFDPS